MVGHIWQKCNLLFEALNECRIGSHYQAGINNSYGVHVYGIAAVLQILMH